jgi:4-diphosphocytidyl-2-C-methyl-D-erythritol kinase
MIVRAPAKINIGLNVISKRDDGYHNIETVFYPLNLSDEINIEASDKLNFTSSDPLLSEDNLILKAVELLEQKAGRIFNLDIHLKKNIPVGAGLGGGSSDAAAVMLYLNDVYKLNIPQAELKETALKLGSDVPFFLNPVPSFAESRGEMVEPLNFNIPYPILIVNPGIHISTKKAYDRIIPSKPLYNLKQTFQASVDYSNLKELVTNDFEKVIFEEFLEIAEIKSRMYYMGSLFSLMTGSGSTVFGIFPDLQTAEAAAENFGENYYTFIHTGI